MNHEATQPDAAAVSQLELLACGDLSESDRGPLLAWLEEDPRRWRLFGLAALEAQTFSQALASSGCHGSVSRAEETLPQASSGCHGAVSRAESTSPRPDAGRHVIADGTPHGASAAGGTQPWHPPVPFRRGAYATALAASVVAAFALGFAARGAGLPAGTSMTQTIADDRQASPPVAAGDARPDKPSGASPVEPILASLRVQSGLAAAATVQVPVRPVRSDGTKVESGTGLADYVRAKWRRQGFDLNVERRYLFANLSDGTPIVVPIEQISLHRVASPVH